MRVGFFIMVCILLTGCGLFNSTKRIDQQGESFSLSRALTLSDKLHTQALDLSQKQLKAASISQGRWKIYPVVGTTLFVQADGSVAVHADSILGQHSQHMEWEQQTNNQISESSTMERDSSLVIDSLSSRESYKKNVEREVSIWAVVANVCIGLLLMGGLGFLLAKYGRRFVFW